MSFNPTRRNLIAALNDSTARPGHPKMATVTSRGLPCLSDSIADQDQGALPSSQSSDATVSTPPGIPSPASTESLIRRTLGGAALTPQQELIHSPDPWDAQARDSPPDFPSMMAAFSQMLSNGLSHTAAQITATIPADLQQIGARILVLEQKSDQAILRINQNTSRIQDLQEKLESASSKIDDLENRSRWYNFRIRGLPETVKDTHIAVQDFIKSLIPNIPAHRLELDRAHRALQPPCSDGLPRDIIVKSHFYAVKEVMKLSRSAEMLMIQGHQIQIFTDLSPYTVQKRRALKPLLQVLAGKEITYR